MRTMIDIGHALASLMPLEKALHRQRLARDLGAVFPGINIIPQTSDEGPSCCTYSAGMCVGAGQRSV